MGDPVVLIAGLFALALALSRRSALAPGGRLSVDQVKAIAERVTSTWFPGLDPLWLRAIAEIESARKPDAVRPEPAAGDASIGLMQVLLGTAQWLFDAKLATAKGRPEFADLLDPETSMYFAAGYLDWLSDYKGVARPEEWIIRGYNGGPGGAAEGYTREYWSRYSAAKARLQAGG